MYIDLVNHILLQYCKNSVITQGTSSILKAPGGSRFAVYM